jgi:hypothetical protein
MVGLRRSSRQDDALEGPHTALTQSVRSGWAKLRTSLLTGDLVPRKNTPEVAEVVRVVDLSMALRSSLGLILSSSLSLPALFVI